MLEFEVARRRVDRGQLHVGVVGGRTPPPVARAPVRTPSASESSSSTSSEPSFSSSTTISSVISSSSKFAVAAVHPVLVSSQSALSPSRPALPSSGPALPAPCPWSALLPSAGACQGRPLRGQGRGRVLNFQLVAGGEKEIECRLDPVWYFWYCT